MKDDLLIMVEVTGDDMVDLSVAPEGSVFPPKILEKVTAVLVKHGRSIDEIEQYEDGDRLRIRFSPSMDYEPAMDMDEAIQKAIA
jgi:hypothetical protein